MASDPRKLKPGELCRLLNSTPLGAVIDAARLRRHRDAAGLRIGDGKTVNLLAYAAWLAAERHGDPAASLAAVRGDDGPRDEPADAYERKKAREAARSRLHSQSGRDIGPLPPVQNPKRRAEAEKSFQAFLEHYFPHIYTLAWSKDHLASIDRIEKCIRAGGRYAWTMPRGSGKTSLSEEGVIYATITGQRRFGVLIGADKDSANDSLDSIKAEFEFNDLLFADFPEVFFPIRCLEGIAQRARAQLHEGRRTHIRWETDTIRLPTIEGSPASGAILRVRGITGRVRGMKATTASGESIRPDIALIDDAQTDESARSPTQTTERERIINGAILGLAGPGKRIAALHPCTIIRDGCLAHRLTDRKRNPQWHGDRFKMLYKWPKDEDLLEEYAEKRRNELRRGGDGSSATKWYRRNRKKIEAGAEVAWPARKEEGEVSGLQHALNKWIDDPNAFAAECQNDPIDDTKRGDDLLTAGEIAALTNGLKRGVAPLACDLVTAFIDVQKTLLWWLVVGWSDDFGGAILDYGAWPDQRRKYFSLRDAKRTIGRVYQGLDEDAAMYAAVNECVTHLVAQEWPVEDKSHLRTARIVIDANYKSDLVYELCRRHEHSALLMPSHGKGFRVNDKPISRMKPSKGDRLGFHWMIPSNAGKRAVRHLIIDTNFWKSFVHARMALGVGGSGALTLFGKRGTDHQMLGEHLTAESRQRASGRWGEVDLWTEIPGRDNHLFDCLVGAAVAASLQGCNPLPGGKRTRPKKKRPRRRVDYL